jgi:hypothetical protein
MQNPDGSGWQSIPGNFFCNFPTHYDFGKPTKIADTLHESLRTFLATLVASVTNLTLVTDLTTSPMPAKVTVDNMVTLVTVVNIVPCKLWLLECAIKAVPLRTFSALFYSLLHTKLNCSLFSCSLSRKCRKVVWRPVTETWDSNRANCKSFWHLTLCTFIDKYRRFGDNLFPFYSVWMSDLYPEVEDDRFSRNVCADPLNCTVPPQKATILKLILTPWSRILLENITGPQLVKIFPAFYGTRRFITSFTSAHRLSLSWARSIQSMPPKSHFLKIHLNIILSLAPGYSEWYSWNVCNF